MKKILLISTLSLILLSACSEGTPAEQNPAATETNKETIGVTKEDNQAYISALQNKDVSSCDKISSEEYKKACLDEVNDSKKLDEAQTTLNKEVCNGMSTEERKTACVSSVESSIRSNEQRAEYLKQVNAATDELNRIIAGKDYTKCKDITDANYRVSCEVNILMALVNETGDTSKCKLASEPDAIKICEQSVQPVEQQNQ